MYIWHLSPGTTGQSVLQMSVQTMKLLPFLTIHKNIVHETRLTFPCHIKEQRQRASCLVCCVREVS